MTFFEAEQNNSLNLASLIPSVCICLSLLPLLFLTKVTYDSEVFIRSSLLLITYCNSVILHFQVYSESDCLPFIVFILRGHLLNFK